MVVVTTLFLCVCQVNNAKKCRILGGFDLKSVFNFSHDHITHLEIN